MHKNLALLGDLEGLDLRKKAGETDITYFSRLDSGDIYSIFSPRTYPEKIQSMLVSVGLADLVVLRVNEINWGLGEEIIACDLLNKPGILLGEDWILEQVEPLLKGTSLSDWEKANSEKEMWDLIREWNPPERKGLEVWIDQAFKVKSVGTVVLGIVKAGVIHVHDRLKIMPAGKEVEVKSIQMQDKDFKEASANARVGLGLKGIEPDEIPRGSIMGDVSLTKTIPSWEKLSLFKGDKKDATHVFHGISFVGYQNEQLVRGMPISKVNETFLTVENTNKKGLRIVGHGDING